MELMELQCDSILKQKYAEVGIPEFYTFLSRERFPRLLAAAAARIIAMFGRIIAMFAMFARIIAMFARIIAMFGSTYVREQFFSSMKVNKSVLRSRLTDEHLQATLRLVSSHKFKPNIEVLVDAKRCQLSSQNKN